MRAESVLGVMVAPEADGPEELVTMARNVAVFGEGGGKAIGPLPRGVRPVLKLERSGVKPVLKLGSKALVDDWGPASIAGDKGPARSDPVRAPPHG